MSGSLDRWELLPSYDEVVEACKIFGTSFFQLGFLSKAIFLEQLASHRSTINVFFLLAILSVSARFTPCLISRYNDGLKAAEIFMTRAQALVIEEMYTPTLERTQAFFLLAIAEWGKGDKTSSNIHMGIAVRMAGLLRLHREETYDLPKDFSAEDVINAEMARRTFWMLESQDNLHSGYSTPTSFSLDDITTLLPCEERDFAFGLMPQERTALAGTLSAARNPNIVHTSSRSLFATPIQAHNLWGQVARRAVSSSEQHTGENLQPWDHRSDYAVLSLSLQTWEEHLPIRHQWSIWNLRGYKAEGLDLAYLSVVMVLRLSNIILRRSFIENIISHPTPDSAPEQFWSQMSEELFKNVLALHEQIDAFFSLRSQEQGFPAMIVFCVYVCGSLASHLWKRREMCPRLFPGVEDVVSKSLEVLTDLQHAWPLARRWRQALEERSSSMLEQQRVRRERFKDAVEMPGHGSVPKYSCSQLNNESTKGDRSLADQNNGGPHNINSMQYQNGGQTMLGIEGNFSRDPQQSIPSNLYSVASPADDMEAQLAAFIQVQGQLGMLYE